LAAAGTADEIPGSYIVVLRGEPKSASVAAPRPADPPAVARAVGLGATVNKVYRYALNGYAARLSATQLDAVRRDADVAYVAADTVVRPDTTQTPTPNWGLDRIDQRTLPLNSTYNYTFTGAGVRAYVIDTGIRTTHTEFTGRLAPGWSAINDGRGTDDCAGHGTHVAGIIGGTRYGVAKGVTLVPVRVFPCTGSASRSDVVAAVDWVTADHATHPGPAVANMSLGHRVQWFDIGDPERDAVNRSLAAGVSYSVSAGNDNSNACDYSPARTPSALTVGSTAINDVRSSFSNVGSCLDLFAPGSAILSAWFTSDSATATLSGTSMAAPHVTGAVARFLEEFPTASPFTVSRSLTNVATAGMVGDPGTGSPNRLLAVSVPSTVVVPDVRGRQLPTATQMLQAAGLTLGHVGSITVHDSSDGGKVMFQNPPAGSSVLPGTSVALDLGLFQGPNR